MARNCAMETGALIGAQYVVGGSISKNGNSYDILLRLFSVVTGAEKATREVTYKGPVDGFGGRDKNSGLGYDGTETAKILNIKPEGKNRGSWSHGNPPITALQTYGVINLCSGIRTVLGW